MATPARTVTWWTYRSKGEDILDLLILFSGLLWGHQMIRVMWRAHRKARTDSSSESITYKTSTLSGGIDGWRQW